MVTIRYYTENDLDTVVTLWYKSWSNMFPELKHPQPFEAWKFRFKNDLAINSTAWVAENQSRIVGFIVINQIKGILEQIFVDVDVQGIGIGTALLNKAKRICPLGLSLTTLQQNLQARKFYEKHGFVAGKLGVNPVNGQTNIEYIWIPNTDSRS
ncbi:GCN5-related N-acetyltransferase [Calothrix sp. NIES-4071]|nr:GCN5-related N-acetyltransferase [Calothrix sp. NIES-4071]BAZ63925.1 GCN5-related N-acetyltransferase [Calothrix sp. NIES-4105]